MFTVVDRPLIQYAVEEAVAAGSSEVVLVSAPGKGSILDHFRIDEGLESVLQERGKDALLEVVSSPLSLLDALDKDNRLHWVRRALRTGRRWTRAGYRGVKSRLRRSEEVV